ncbi:hypothetical protein [Nocardia terpenica]|uniref:Uncharacterized protein n=1 Tax=Nocardia terpenica TaxID=455432 RepID=A0A291RYV0_9NOCA|nr:hypothetical protein [Nocardia terpenica]ATL72500.1 hypothetical protein CRH09_39700 [Nocardia terpenica]
MNRTETTASRSAGADRGTPVLERIARHAEFTRPGSGDYLDTPAGPRRIGHVFPGGFHLVRGTGSYYLNADGTLVYTGGLHGPMVAGLVDTGRRIDGEAWVFGDDRNRRPVTVSVRVWRIEDAADVTGF